jgi:hypothetical protein
MEGDGGWSGTIGRLEPVAAPSAIGIGRAIPERSIGEEPADMPAITVTVASDVRVEALDTRMEADP